MFTGIVQEIGTVLESQSVGGGVHLTVRAPRSSTEVVVRDSIAINGVCQTVIRKTSDTFTVEAVEETLRKTTLGNLRPGSKVNLELAARLGDRMGGHLVQGHVDGTGQVQRVVKKESSWLISFGIPDGFLRYVIPVGSIAIDGVSLTVAGIEGNTITVSIIPHTMENTTFPELKTGSQVNIEFDLIGKYIERLLREGRGEDQTLLSTELLRTWGYDV